MSINYGDLSERSEEITSLTGNNVASLPTEIASRLSGVRAALACAAVLVAPVLMAAIIHRYGVNVPVWDEWDQLAIVTDAYDHTLTFHRLWEQQNEHRPVVYRIISIVMARATDLDLVAEMYLGFGFQVLSLILIWRMMALGLKDRARVLIVPLTIAASLMLFWTVAHEAWIWGIASVQYFLSVLWAVLTVWALSRWPGRWAGVWIASVAMTMAIFTTGSGFALIGVGVLGILGYGIAQRSVRWSQLLVFGLVSVVCVALYFAGHSWVGYSATLVKGHHPVEMVRYFGTYVGSPFWFRTAGIRSCQLLGCAGMVSMGAAAYYLLRKDRSWLVTLLPWLLLACYTLFNAAETAFARIGFGVEQAGITSRYRAIAIPFWLSLTVILSIISYEVRGQFSRRVVATASAAAIVLFLTGYGFLYYRAYGALARNSALIASSVPDIMNYGRASDDDLRRYHWSPPIVRELSRKLDQYHLGPFRKAK